MALCKCPESCGAGQHYPACLPGYIPLPHLSPKIRWIRNNPWFEAEVLLSLLRRGA
ncbi:MAG: hypothetical protein JSU75_05930 [Gammaproteobacteria bacterium]|nr:MAG: hypothetical protein JSU75_05930 [Gammaproteobacteria bacterium]